MKQRFQKSTAFFALFAVAFLPTGVLGDFVKNTDRLEVKSELFDSLKEEFIPGELLVKFRGDREARVLRLPLGRQVKDAVREYRGRRDVVFAEPNFIARALFTPNDPYFGLQWHFDNPAYGGIHTKVAWDTGSGSGVTVAIVDTGIAYENYTNPANGKEYYKAPDLSSTCFVAGYDYIENDPHPNDDNSHGTHVAGTVAQSTNNSVGVAGVAFSSCLMPVKVLNQNGAGTYAQVVAGIRFAADNGAKVINLSLGGASPSQTLEDAVAYAYGKGVTVVAAAGNDGTNQVSYPAAYDAYVIAVGATRFDETLSYYSSFGSSLDIVAPGGDTSVDQNDDGYADGVLQNTFNPNTKSRGSFGYWFFQGTSMAAPHAAGVAALVIGNGNATTPDEVRSALQETADDLGVSGRDNIYGWGLINALAALSWSAGPPPPPPPPPTDNPPSVSITLPLAGAEVSGVITGAANASDYNGVAAVDFLLDNAVLASDAAAPFETPWDTTLASEGSHALTAVAYDTIGQTASSSVSVLVDNVNSPPTANAGPDQSATTGQTASFNGSGSSDPDGSIVSYNWNFGDGASASGVSVSHAYAAAGNYTVTLSVTDNDGAIAQDQAVVAVSDPPAEIEVFFDSFEISEWNSLWTEDSQNDWFRSSQRATDGTRSAEVDGEANKALLTSIPINLQGRTKARINFSWLIESSLDSGEYLIFEVSTNGGVTWVEKSRLRGNVDPENVWHAKSFELSSLANLKLRFKAKMSSSDEDANVDLVKVAAW